MKYIDADKLHQQIKRLKEENHNIRCQHNEKYCIGYDDAFNDLLSFIDSLQQEEPEEVCIFKPNMTIDEMKDSLNGKQQEQPEVDLEEVDLTEEINRYCGTRDVRPVPDFMETVARHFAKWSAEQFAKTVRANLSEIGNNAQSQFEQLYLEITGTKLFGGYND